MATNQYKRDGSFYEALIPFAHKEDYRIILEHLATGLSQRETASLLEIGASTVERAVAAAKDRQNRSKTPRELAGDLDTPISDPLILKGVSTFYNNETGEATRTWIKSDIDKTAQLKQILDSVESAIGSYKPLKRVKAPRKGLTDVLTIYPMGDPHIGMYAWSAESGEDFDCDIAEKNLRAAMVYLVEKAPPSETAIILNLGDFFHGDSTANTTTKGTPIDLDSRWGRVYEIGMTLMIDCVNLALEKHKKVIVRNNTGNHDKHTSQALSIAMKHIFKNNPRVEIAEAANPFFMYEFGNNMIFSTHGDGLKPTKAHGFIANAFSEIWGRTEHRLALFGHFHHEDRREENGLIVEIFNTLASSDAWHHASGYRSKRNMKCIVLDKSEGEIERYTFNLSRKLLESHNGKA